MVHMRDSLSKLKLIACVHFLHLLTSHRSLSLLFTGLSHLQKQRLMNMNNKYEGNMPFSSNQQTRMHTSNPAQFSVEDDLGLLRI